MYSFFLKVLSIDIIFSTFFDMEPRVFKMSAGEKVELTVTGLSNKVATVKEMWYLIGSVEGINKKELLLECQVVAEFVDPKIELSSSIMNFQYDNGPYSEFYKLTGTSYMFTSQKTFSLLQFYVLNCYLFQIWLQ